MLFSAVFLISTVSLVSEDINKMSSLFFWLFIKYKYLKSCLIAINKIFTSHGYACTIQFCFCYRQLVWPQLLNMVTTIHITRTCMDTIQNLLMNQASMNILCSTMMPWRYLLIRLSIYPFNLNLKICFLSDWTFQKILTVLKISVSSIFKISLSLWCELSWN